MAEDTDCSLDFHCLRVHLPGKPGGEGFGVDHRPHLGTIGDPPTLGVARGEELQVGRARVARVNSRESESSCDRLHTFNVEAGRHFGYTGRWGPSTPVEPPVRKNPAMGCNISKSRRDLIDPPLILRQ